MTTSVTTLPAGDLPAMLERHSDRRRRGCPTVSVLVGPVAAGRRAWGRWSESGGRAVVVHMGDGFPRFNWIVATSKRFDLPAAAVRHVAGRAGRNPDELLAEWRSSTAEERSPFWESLIPQPDDRVLRGLTSLAVIGCPSDRIVAPLCRHFGDRLVPVIVRLTPPEILPGVLTVTKSVYEFRGAACDAARCSVLTPAIPVGVVASTETWEGFLAEFDEGPVRTLLTEGLVPVPVLDEERIAGRLAEAGVETKLAAILATTDADEQLVEAAVAAVRALSAEGWPRARTALEGLLFEFLESIPVTSGRFERDRMYPFAAGPQRVYLFSACPQVAIELEGFPSATEDHDQRDRKTDKELQQRGWVVLRFVAEDVIGRLEMIRDRILEAFGP